MKPVSRLIFSVFISYSVATMAFISSPFAGGADMCNANEIWFECLKSLDVWVIIFNPVYAVLSLVLVGSAFLLNAVWPKTDLHVFTTAVGVASGLLCFLFLGGFVDRLDILVSSAGVIWVLIAAIWILFVMGPYLVGLFAWKVCSPKQKVG